MTNDPVREWLSEWLDKSIIEQVTVKQGLQDVTAPDDEYKQYLRTGEVTVEIRLRPQ